MVLPVTQIQRFSVHDGPGIRTTVFFKGCPLRCRWCHNPETQESRDQILYTAGRCIGCGACAAVCPSGAHRLDGEGRHAFDAARCTGCLACAAACPARAIEPASRPMTPEEILREALRDAAFYGGEGGLTLSGGEPLSHPEGCLTLLQRAKEQGLSTAVETCGLFDPAILPALAPLVDWFLWDYKDSDPVRHRANTGVSPAPIWRNLARLDAILPAAAGIELRCILLNGVNFETAHFEAVARTAASLRHLSGVRIFPYHPLGGSKAVRLGLADNSRKEWIPSEEQMAEARERLTRLGVPLL